MMRIKGFICLMISGVLLSLGCEKPNTTKPKPVDTTLDKAKEKVKDAADAVAAAAREKRDQYVADMNKQLDALNVKMEEWKAQAAKAEGQAKKDLEKKLEDAKVKRDAVAKKLTEVKEASLDRWEKVKEGVGSAYDDLKKIFE